MGKQEEDFYLTVKPTTKISAVKKCIELIHKIPINKQCLIYNDDLLDDTKTIYSHAVKDGAEVLLVIELTIIKIKLKSLSGETYDFKVEPSLTIEDFKLIVQSRTGVPPRRHRLIYAGRGIYADESTLEENHIKDGSVIHSVLSQIGS